MQSHLLMFSDVEQGYTDQVVEEIQSLDQDLRILFFPSQLCVPEYCIT